MRGKTNVSSPPSNDNILINWYLADPINQRGQTEYNSNGKYTIDGWLQNYSKVNAENGVTITFDETSGKDFGHFYQKLDSKLALGNKTMTLSFLYDDNKLIYMTGVMPETIGTGVNSQYFDDGKIFMQLGRFSSENYQVVIAHKFTDGISPIAAKLELGSQQTLAHLENGKWVLNDPPPNKAEELLKCQRYFYKYNGQFLIGSWEGSYFFETFQLPVTMRTIPSISNIDYQDSKGTVSLQVAKIDSIVFKATTYANMYSFEASAEL